MLRGSLISNKSVKVLKKIKIGKIYSGGGNLSPIQVKKKSAVHTDL